MMFFIKLKYSNSKKENDGRNNSFYIGIDNWDNSRISTYEKEHT